MKTYTSGTKCCATCANWGGARQVKNAGAYVETPALDTRGKCYAGTPCPITQGPMGSQQCAKYQKWSAVK